MNTQLAKPEATAIAEQVLIGGDLSKLTSEQRATYYMQVCESVGLNPYTKPFDYITLSGKLTLYARRDATDQLRKAHGVSVSITGRERIDDVYVVTAKAVDRDGRTDESTGVVALANLKGDALANALMKAETKAKRRVTLSICGLGWMDESELETTPARRVNVDAATGEIIDAQPVNERTGLTEDEFQSGLEDDAEPADLLTEKQGKLIHVLLTKKFAKTENGKEELLAFKQANLGDAKRHTSTLTKSEASAYIDALNELEDIQE